MVVRTMIVGRRSRQRRNDAGRLDLGDKSGAHCADNGGMMGAEYWNLEYDPDMAAKTASVRRKAHIIVK